MDAPSALTARAPTAVMRRCATFARLLSRAPSDVGGGGACASRRPSRLHHARLSVVAKSSKASKVGRFPHVPSTDAHPIVRDGLDLGELCATWRAGAGAPGAAVVRDLEAMMMMEAPREDPTAPRGDLEGVSSRASSWRLLLSRKNENLYNAYALEVDAASPGSFALCVGLFALPRPVPLARLARLAGLRAVVDPLACAPTLELLAERVTALPVNATLPPDVPTALYHDVVARLSDRDRPSGPEVYETVGDAVGAWGAGFEHGAFARFKGENPNDPRVVEALQKTLRFVVIECAKGYAFGLATYAPPRAAAKCDWTRKPNNYSAGTQPAIAAAAINAVLDPVLLGTRDATRDDARRDDARRSDASSSEKKSQSLGAILDPCCGGGTMLHAAWTMGAASVGGDVNARNAENARGNLAAFRAHMPAQHAQLVAIGAAPADALPNLPRGDEHEGILDRRDRAKHDLLTPTPDVVVADVLATDAAFWRRALAKSLGKEGGGSAARSSSPGAPVAFSAVVSNLPFGRQVRVGGKGGDGKRGDCTEAELEPLLVALRDLAPRHAFVTGAPVAATMRRLGYENVSEVPICRHGRIFLTAALGKEGRVLRPSVSFTMEEAMRAKREGERVNKDAPAWVQGLVAAGEKDPRSGKALKPLGPATTRGGKEPARDPHDPHDPHSKPPLRVAVDASYDQDSQRAIRSVAKQLSECLGVARKYSGVALTFAGFRGVVAEHALEHFNAARWRGVAVDQRDVEELFLMTDESGDGDGDGDGDENENENENENDSPQKQKQKQKRKVVYLSPDAEATLEDVDGETQYVIGGIVDLAARGTAWSLPRANAMGVEARRLPVKENAPGATNQILNIDTVLKVLCEKYLGEKDWQSAMDAALPRRKIKERPARKNRPRDAAEETRRR